jgi:serine/threonine protein kinase
MPRIKDLLTEYLSKPEIISMIESYDNKQHNNLNYLNLLLQFHTILCRDIFPLLIGEQKMANVCGSGTVGFVVSLENDHFTFDKFEQQMKLYRVRKSTLEMPKKLALKIQIFHTKDKYWEARVLREEFIQNKLSESKTFKDYIPNFYFGCTVNMPIENDIIRFRLTFMDLIDIKQYITLINYLQSTNGVLSDIIYNKIKDLVHNLWRFRISHNDLSLNNILINIKNQDIKLIDFGLSTMIEKLEGEDINLSTAYINYFANQDKLEQNGSNVEKLKNLLTYVKK